MRLFSEPDCSSAVPMDIGILIDSSRSIGEANFQVLKNSLKLFIEESPVSPSGPYHIGLAQFSTDVKVITNFAQSQTKGNFRSATK